MNANPGAALDVSSGNHPRENHPREIEKRNAAEKSLEYVESNMRLGLGSGSTAAYLIEMLGQRIRQGLQIRAVSTSERTTLLAKAAGISLATLEELPHLDLTIDGADEVDRHLQLIKGGGGALLREKVVAAASDRLIIIGDSTKQVEQLGAFPLPVEVIAFAWKPIAEQITQWGVQVALRKDAQGHPFRTDERHVILDCRFGHIPDPRALAQKLNAIPGVIDHGLFVDMVDTLIIGRGNNVEVIHRPPSK